MSRVLNQKSTKKCFYCKKRKLEIKATYFLRNKNKPKVGVYCCNKCLTGIISREGKNKYVLSEIN